MPALPAALRIGPRGRSAETALVVLVAALDVTTQWNLGESQGLLVDGRPPLPLAVFSLVGYCALAWRREAPLLVFGAVWLHSVAAHALIPGYRPTLAVLVALYTAAALLPLRRSVVALTGAGTVSALSLAQELELGTPAAERGAALVAGVLLYLLVDLGVWGAGLAVAAHGRERVLLEAARGRAAREAVREERVRLSLELHDVVAHTVTLMVLQAATARRLNAPGSAVVRRALQDIEGMGKQTMVELRSLLGFLGEPDPVSCATDPSGVDELTARMRAAGLRLEVSGTDRLASLPPEVHLAVTRVVREGLTNVLRHAGSGARCWLAVTERRGALEVTVRDDGRGRTDPSVTPLSGGRGLLGLAERAAGLGGTVAWGQDAAGGFVLSATFPIQDSEPERRALEPALLRASR